MREREALKMKKVAILGMVLLLVIAFGVYVYKENTKPFEPPMPIVKTGEKNVKVYLGHYYDSHSEVIQRERNKGETITRMLYDVPTTVLSDKEDKITIQFATKKVPSEFEIIRKKQIEDVKGKLPDANITEEIVKSTKDKEITIQIPKEEGEFQYIIRATFEESVVDYGFLIKKDS